MLMRNVHDSSNINKTECRVTGALDPDQLRLRPDEFRDIELNTRRERNLDTVGGGDLGEIAVRAAVDV